MTRSHGDGRRMTLAEAVERRERIIRAWPKLGLAVTLMSRCGWPVHYVPRRNDRRWANIYCESPSHRGRRRARKAEDVGLLDGIPVAMCAACRAAQREQTTRSIETLEDLAGDFLSAVERALNGATS